MRPAARGRAPPPCPGRLRRATKASKSSSRRGRGGSRRGRRRRRPDRPGRARVVRPGDSVLLAPLRNAVADRVDRRQVDDVEAHGGDRRQPLGGGRGRCPSASGGAPRRARRPPTAGTARTRRRTARARGPPRAGSRSRRGDQARAPGARSSSATTSGSSAGASRSSARAVGVAQRARPPSARPRAHRSGTPVGGALVQPGALLETRSTSWPSGILISASCRQVPSGSPQASTQNLHAPAAST